MSGFEMMLVGVLITIFAGFFVAFGVFVILAVHKLDKSVKANTEAVLALGKSFDRDLQVEVSGAVKLIASNFPAMIAQTGALAKLIGIFNDAVLSGKTAPSEPAGTPGTIPPNVLGNTDQSTFTPYDEEAMEAARAAEEAKKKGSLVPPQEFANPPKPEQMVNGGEAQAIAMPVAPAGAPPRLDPIPPNAVQQF